jgi:hypothetical protein
MLTLKDGGRYYMCKPINIGQLADYFSATGERNLDRLLRIHPDAIAPVVNKSSVEGSGTGEALTLTRNPRDVSPMPKKSELANPGPLPAAATKKPDTV